MDAAWIDVKAGPERQAEEEEQIPVVAAVWVATGSRSCRRLRILSPMDHSSRVLPIPQYARRLAPATPVCSPT